MAEMHGRCVGAKKRAGAVRPLRQIKGVVHLPRRVIFGDIEGGEIVEIVLDIGALGQGEAHLAEDGEQFVHGLADRMDAAVGLGPRRQGDVDALALEPFLEPGILERRLSSIDGVGQDLLDGIQRHARVLAFFGRQGADALHALGDKPLPAEDADADLLEAFEILGPGDGGQERQRG